MFKLGDIVKLKQREVIGYISEIKPKSKTPWNIKIIFFNEYHYNEYGHYTETDLIKVSDEQMEEAIQETKKEIS